MYIVVLINCSCAKYVFWLKLDKTLIVICTFNNHMWTYYSSQNPSWDSNGPSII